MIRKTLLAAGFVGGAMLLVSPVFAANPGPGAKAAQCRDAHGKFKKCPPPVAAKPVRCRNVKSGHFAKCGTPGAKPV